MVLPLQPRHRPLASCRAAIVLNLHLCYVVSAAVQSSGQKCLWIIGSFLRPVQGVTEESGSERSPPLALTLTPTPSSLQLPATVGRAKDALLIGARVEFCGGRVLLEERVGRAPD